MELDRTRGASSVFMFVHNKNYQQVQSEFLAAVESLRPENIMVRKQQNIVVVRLFTLFFTIVLLVILGCAFYLNPGHASRSSISH